MVGKKRKGDFILSVIPTNVISENDRLKTQLLNSYVDRANSELKVAKIALENAKLLITIAQRNLNVATSDLDQYGAALAENYNFDQEKDQVNWATGEIIRGGEIAQGENPIDEDNSNV